MESSDKFQTLPMLHIHAESYYEVGWTIGNTFKGWINDYLDSSSDVVLFRKFYANEAGRKICERYLNVTKLHFPKIFDEIRGIADGASVALHDIFLLQIASEILFSHAEEVFPDHVPAKQQQSPDKGCTDLLVNKERLRVIAHNDDWEIDVSKRVYMVHVTICHGDVIDEQFISYMYPGYLAGFTFAVNRHLVITQNTVRPKHAVQTGVPLLVLLRATLACKSIEECRTVMENKPNGCSFGMNLNIASIDGLEMCSMEVYPEENGTIISIRHVPYVTSDSDGEGFYHHQNMYKNVTREQTVSDGSELRAARVKAIGEPGTIDDIRAILGDTECAQEPLYRVPADCRIEQTVKTTATAIFDLVSRKLDVYRINPKLATRPCMSIPFL